MRSLLIALSTSAFCLSVVAEPLPAPARAEVDALLARLESSGCDFNRNGTWYTAADAKAHLLRKLDYLEGNNLIRTTEQFIELGASQSSASGKPYLVRCGKAAPVDSRTWLLGELKTVRSSR